MSALTKSRGSGFKKYLDNTLWLLAERIFRILVALAVTIVTARYLGPDKFGILNYAISFVALFAALATVGLDKIIVRELVLYDEKQREILGTAVVLRLVSALIMTAMAISAAFIVSKDRTANTMIVILCLVSFLQSASVIEYYFQAKVQSRFVVRVQLISVIFSGLTTIGLIYLGMSVTWFVVPKIVEALVFCAGLVFVFSENVGPLWTWKFQSGLAKRLFRDSWPLIFTGVFISIYMRIDQVMIKYVMGNTAVGYYAVAVRLCEAGYFIPMVIVTSVFPAIINARKENLVLYHQRLQNLYDLMTWLAIAVAIPMSFLGKDLLRLLFGVQYLESYGVLALYVWTSLFVFQGVARNRWIVAENLQIYGFWFSFCSAMSNIILNLVLIPLLGLMGAAVATILSQCATVIIFPLLFEKTRESSGAILKSFNFIRIVGNLMDKRLFTNSSQ